LLALRESFFVDYAKNLVKAGRVILKSPCPDWLVVSKTRGGPKFREERGRRAASASARRVKKNLHSAVERESLFGVLGHWLGFWAMLSMELFLAGRGFPPPTAWMIFQQFQYLRSDTPSAIAAARRTFSGDTQ
jgi:hypothetical protein